jgi:hypothetical protein
MLNTNLTGGLSFCQVFKKKQATCQVKIRGGPAAHSRDPEKGMTLAEAFFPGHHHSTIDLFPAAFTEANVVFLANVFGHELIHVLGVRHYFAQKEDRGKFLQQPVEVGQRNEKSISNYFTSLGELQIQKSDVEALGILYTQKHTTIHGLPVSYHHAVPLSWWKDVESDPEECLGIRVAESVSQRGSFCEEGWTTVDGPAQEDSCTKVGGPFFGQLGNPT